MKRLLLSKLVLILCFLVIYTSSNAQNDCATAVNINSLPFASGTLTTCGTIDDYVAGTLCNSLYGDGEDYVFKYTATSTGNYGISLGGAATYKIASVHTACPPTSVNCVGSIVTSSGTTATGNVSLTVGTLYYIIVDTWPAPDCGEFTLGLTAPPTCPPPTALTATGITTTSANIGWTAGGSETAWEYVYGVSPVAAPSGAGTATTNNPTTISGLTSATTYQFYVRANCGAGDYSTWAGPYTFTTACSPITDFFENFDSYPTGSIVPTCWNRLIVGSGSQTITSTSPASGTRNIYQYSSGVSNQTFVILPELSNVSAGTHRFKAKFRVSSGTGELELGYLTNITDAATYTLIQTIPITNTTYGSETIINIPNTVPSGARLCVRNSGVTTSSHYWDDAGYEAIPSCPNPTTLTATGITLNSANIGWTAGGSETAWEYVYGISPVPAPSGSGTSTMNNPTTITGLSTGTTYQFYVRADCGGEFSTWSGPFTFTTTIPNDEPCGAIPVAVGSTCTYTQYTTAGATASSGPPAPGCAGSVFNDVWFSFTVPASGATILNSNTGVIIDGGMAIYSSSDNTCTGTFTLLECDDDDSPNGDMSYISRKGLTPGSTIFIRFWEYGGDNNGTFSLCVSDVAINDECAGAKVLSVSPTTTCTTALTGENTIYATSSGTACSGTGDDDLWYSFVATSSVHVVTLSNITPSTTMVTQAYSGTCASLTQIACSTTAGTNLTGLTPGSTYYLKIHTSSGSGTYATFDVCITQAPDMVFVSCTVGAQNTATVGAGAVDANIVRLDVVVNGLGNPLSADRWGCSTNGSTSPVTNNITTAKIYYTGTSSTFTTTTLVGSTAIAGDGGFTIMPAQVLTGGTSNTTNYFWLAYDLKCTAVNNDLLDGEFNNVRIGGINQTPTAQSFAGTRTITALASYDTKADGNWNDPNVWACSAPPSGTTLPININHNVNLNTDFAYDANLTVAAGKTLTINTNILTVGPVGGGNKLVTINGVLTMNGGTLNVNGRVIFGSNSTFNFSNGDFNIDGNGTSSVTAVLLTLGSPMTFNMTGGTLTYIDPLPSSLSSTSVISYAGTNTLVMAGGKLRFGDGISTAVGPTNGFYYNPGSGGKLRWYDVEINGGTGTRKVYVYYELIAKNLLEIKSGCELQMADDIHVVKNLINNGTFYLSSSSYYLCFGDYNAGSGTSITPTSNVQTVTGNGIYQNLLTAPTANMYNLHINNTSGTPIVLPPQFYSGVGTGSISNNLYLTNGIIDLGGGTLTLGTSGTSNGTLNPTTPTSASYIIGKFERWIATGGAGTNRYFPIGTATKYRPILINYSVGPTTAGKLAAEFVSMSPGVSGLPLSYGGIVCETSSPTGYWQMTPNTLSGGTYTATVDASDFTKSDGVTTITDLANIRLAKRPDAGDWADAATATAPANLNSVTASNMTGFSIFGLIGRADALPIELLSFKGYAEKSVNVLEWVTASESNTDMFVIERSENGKEWKAIAEVEAAGESRNKSSYKATDEQPLNKAYYRLRSVDMDGRFQLSDAIVIERNDRSFKMYSVSPNPNRGDFTVTFNTPSNGETKLVLVNSLGMRVHSQMVNAIAGTNAEFLNVNDLTNGIYTLIIEQEGQFITQRIVINK